jgi:hypothetical protein
MKKKKEGIIMKVRKIFITLEGTGKFISETVDMSPIVNAIKNGITEGVTDAYSSHEEDDVIEVQFKIRDHTKGGKNGG